MVLLVAKNKRILPYFVYFVHKSLSLFPFSQFILKNYGEDPDNYNEQLKKLEQLRQSEVLQCIQGILLLIMCFL